MRKRLVQYFLIAAIGLGTLSTMGHYGGDLLYQQGAGGAHTHQAGLSVSEYTRP
ncbi:MAG: hypothetical protein ABIU05_12025 [Nitrospirales bacterium]